MAKQLKKVSARSIQIFKIKNRRGYAGMFQNHLTEGKSPAEVLARMAKALRRSGFELK